MASHHDRPQLRVTLAARGRTLAGEHSQRRLPVPHPVAAAPLDDAAGGTMSETEHEQPDETPFEAPAPPEHEQDEEEEAAEHETAAEGGPSEADEQTEPASEASLDEAFKKLGKSATTWRNRVSVVLGEDAQHLVPCELCLPEVPGHHWPAELEATRPRDETHAKLLNVLLAPGEPEYRHAPHAHTCEACDGYGLVLSGSKMEQNRLVTCPECGALGYKASGSGVGNGVAVDQPAAALVSVGAPAAPSADEDPWGSPKVLPNGQPNPNYGKMIHFKDPNLP